MPAAAPSSSREGTCAHAMPFSLQSNGMCIVISGGFTSFAMTTSFAVWRSIAFVTSLLPFLSLPVAFATSTHSSTLSTISFSIVASEDKNVILTHPLRESSFIGCSGKWQGVYKGYSLVVLVASRVIPQHTILIVMALTVDKVSGFMRERCKHEGMPRILIKEDPIICPTCRSPCLNRPKKN